MSANTSYPSISDTAIVATEPAIVATEPAITKINIYSNPDYISCYNHAQHWENTD